VDVLSTTSRQNKVSLFKLASETFTLVLNLAFVALGEEHGMRTVLRGNFGHKNRK
jgi:hypothetical protein